MIALFAILIITCLMRRASPYSLFGRFLSMSKISSTGLSPIRFRKIMLRSLSMDIGSYSSSMISSFPDSILEKSRMSLIMVSRDAPEFLIFIKYPRSWSERSLRSKISVMPTMAFMGVRISCDILERKFDLDSFASSARSFASFNSSIMLYRFVTLSIIRQYPRTLSFTVSSLINFS